MSDIDKIRQEIERRKEICEGIFERESDTYYQGKAVAYGELLSFIDSLPEEKPSEDLEEAADKHIKSIDDIERIHTLLYAVKNNKTGVFTFTRLSDEQYEEVLKRYNGTTESSQLTWQDVNKILDISGEMLEEMLEDGDGDFIGMEEAWAKEVLKRFKILKEK